ncbi:MAG TPA: excinuclease ABC subunit UvrC [Gammaproteobacteria bacterium]|nr:excinuclease ABC subunit UvrC [Gammaproteobacteria bacterium]
MSREYLASLSSSPGIYQMIDASNTVLYVGKARNLKKRVSSYFQKTQTSHRLQNLVNQINHIEIMITLNETEALLLENQLIKKFLPKYNILLRDDKSYPYIILTDHEYPRLSSHRGKRVGKASYFGPYTSGLAVRETIKLIQAVFKLRTCRDTFFKNRSRPCLLYQLQKCTAPCVGHISPENYKDDIKHAELLLTGRSREIIKLLKNHMTLASESQQYELAAKLRDQITHIEHIQTKQAVSTTKADSDVFVVVTLSSIKAVEVLSIREGNLIQHQIFYPKIFSDVDDQEILSAFISLYYLDINKSKPKEIIINTKLDDAALLERALNLKVKVAQRGERKRWIEMAEITGLQAVETKLIAENRYQSRLEQLQKIFKLKKLPERLECFDISHHGGEATLASCVVFDQSGPAKKQYRKFNITGITASDDYAAIKQVIFRRYKRVEDLPDIIFIDGGKGQLKKAEEAFLELNRSPSLLVAISKGPDRRPGEEQLFLSGQKNAMLIPSDSEALHLIQHIRDESHRFALMSHRAKKRSNSRKALNQSKK